MRDHLRMPAAAAAAILTIIVAILIVLIATCSSDESPVSPGSPTLTATSTPTASASPSQTLTNSPAPKSGGFDLMRVFPDVGFTRMIDFNMIPGTDGEEAVVITQDGELWRISLTGAGDPTAFGDISNLVNSGFEEGLLSIAFPPDFAESGRVYLYYTRDDAPGTVCADSTDQCSFISHFTVAEKVMNPAPTVVMEIAQPLGNHNGGKLLFGPDGFLYLGLGDGGGAFDTGDNGQNKDTLLGSIIRIDVLGHDTFDIPEDNPFVGVPGADEIWAYGLRNPWRMSFDREIGDLWAGDVGQDDWEEVDFIVEGGNYGWVCYEGSVEENMGAPGCPPSGPVQFPRAVYANAGRDPLGDCAIVGGYVYRGSELPELDGWYIFGDNCSGRVRAFDTESDDPPIVLVEAGVSISSFAELPNGELLVLTYENAIFQLVQN